MDTTHYQQTVELLLSHLGIDLLQIQTTQDEQGAISIALDTPDAPLIIGRHGSGLHALELISALIIRCKQSDHDVQPPMLHIDVGGYKDNYEERLLELTNKKAAIVITELSRETFHPLNSYHRRIVHLHIAEHFPELDTDSVGEGALKRLILKHKQATEDVT